MRYGHQLEMRDKQIAALFEVTCDHFNIEYIENKERTVIVHFSSIEPLTITEQLALITVWSQPLKAELGVLGDARFNEELDLLGLNGVIFDLEKDDISRSEEMQRNFACDNDYLG